VPVAGALLRLKGFIVGLSSLPKLFSTVALFALLLVSAQAQSNPDGAAKLLPARIGDFSAQGAPRSEASEIFGRVKAEDYGVISQARRDYVSADGRKFSVHLVKTGSVASAYSLLTHVASAYYPPQSSPIKLGEVGTASVAGPGRVPGGGSHRVFTEGEDWAVLMLAEEDRRRGRLTRHITSFRKAGDLYRREQEIHHLRLLARSEVTRRLRAVGFRVRALGGYGQLRFAPGHIGFTARKL